MKIRHLKKNQKNVGQNYALKQIRNLFLRALSKEKNKIKLVMTKADIVADIVEETGLERVEALKAVEAFMQSIKGSLASGQNVYLRGFGSFIVKERAEKTGRNISKNTAIIIPAHNVPAFKPAKTFVEDVKDKVKVK